ncbi:Peptidase A1 domain-containing protein [Trichoderma simmonsii]|uniref:Peptidase A1 domain-containing protein n=1 Tax=Trichoderma simmonsii TaxID=1491479 RepID=A0A8G0PDT0_9HYPO|nr:Peptidase A1 domain-containing protein [Trichoderma simmonsii]
MPARLQHLLLWALLMPNALASALDLGLIRRADDPIPSPVSVSPSQFFEGVDGPWSTFELRVGTPAQNIRILPGTSSTQTLVVLPEGCQIINVTDCANSRGDLFNTTASKTWKEIGLFSLGFENALGFTDNGEFGHDSVGLGYLGSGGPVVNNSVIAGVAGTEFYLGVLALNPRPTNFTDQNDPQQSFLQLLKNQSSIPSLSYSYSVGAPYRLNKALGSLILGGYDTSAYQDTNSSYDFFSDQSRDLTIGVQSISTNASADNTVLQSEQISMFIDSSVAEIYLPVDACHAFEKAFGLTYNSTLKMYLVSDSLHSKLTAENPSVTFTITTAITGGSTFNITFPYASFDLQAKPPLVKTASRYFPLKQAANDTQYVLGRTFLQEAYLIVDYERGNFSVHPRVWNASAESNIVTILPPGVKESKPNTESSHSLSGGAIAGIVIGVCIVIAAVALAILRYMVVSRRKKAKPEESTEMDALARTVPETTSTVSPEPPKSATLSPGTLRELEGDDSTKPTPEIEGSTAARRSPMSELESSGTPMAELASPVPISELLSNEIFEMPGSEVPELQGSRVAPVLVLTDSESSEFSFEVEPGVIGVIQQTEEDRQHNTGEDARSQEGAQDGAHEGAVTSTQETQEATGSKGQTEESGNDKGNGHTEGESGREDPKK